MAAGAAPGRRLSLMADGRREVRAGSSLQWAGGEAGWRFSHPEPLISRGFGSTGIRQLWNNRLIRAPGPGAGSCRQGAGRIQLVRMYAMSLRRFARRYRGPRGNCIIASMARRCGRSRFRIRYPSLQRGMSSAPLRQLHGPHRSWMLFTVLVPPRDQGILWSK